MKYKKIEKDNYNLHLIDTNRFKEIGISIFFSRKVNHSEMALSSLLTQNLVYSSKKYNTKNKIAIVSEELYDSKVSSAYKINGNVESIEFSVSFLNPKYTSEKHLSDSIDFLYEVLMNPNVDNNHFYNEYFNIIKKDYINYIKSIKDNPVSYSGARFNELFFKDTALSKTNPTVSEVEEVTSEKLYLFYKKLFNKNYNVDIFVHGENANEFESIIDSKFSNIKASKNKLNINIKKDNNCDEVIDVMPFNQSRLFIGYDINQPSKHELEHVLKVYNTILGSMNDSMLFNYVREEYSLCYSIGSSFNTFCPSLLIFAGINKENYEETKKRIFEVMEFMKDREKVLVLFESAKKVMDTIINSFYDDAQYQLNYYYLKCFNNKEDIEKLRKAFDKVTIEEIIEFNNRLSLGTIYLMKGDN